jgi:phytoene dehydrogenase-like protein
MRTLFPQPESPAAAPRALVVGGGVAGLAAAWHLSRGGAAVTLIEGAAGLGGRAATRLEGGFSFNMGPHALYRRGEWKKLLDQAGVAYEGGRPPVGGGFGIYRGAVVDMPSTPWTIATSRFLGLRDKARVLRFFARLPNLPESEAAGRTLAQLLDEVAGNSRARAFAEGFFRVATYANAPDKLCAAAAIRQAKRAIAGVLYVAGGWSSLVEGLAAVLRRDGVQIENGAKVARVVTHNETATGVELADGRKIEADLVVLAVRPQTLLRLLPESAAARLRPALEAAIPSAAACLDLALERLPKPEVLFALGFDQPTYYSVHSAATRLGPPGKVLLHAARYLAPGEQPRRAEAEADLEQMMDLLQPGWRGLELHRQLLPQMVVQDSLPLAGATRPGIGAAGIAGLRLAGDWVESTALLADAAADSAERAAGELLAEAGLGQDALRRTA